MRFASCNFDSSLFMFKAVRSGRGGEVIVLTEANLFR